VKAIRCRMDWSGDCAVCMWSDGLALRHHCKGVMASADICYAVRDLVNSAASLVGPGSRAFTFAIVDLEHGVLPQRYSRESPGLENVIFVPKVCVLQYFG